MPLSGMGSVNLASSCEQAAADYASPPSDRIGPSCADVKRVEVTGTLSPDQSYDDISRFRWRRRQSLWA